MASLGLNFHIDKENATPGIGKGDVVRFGPRNKGLKSVQATPQKALFGVKKDVKGTGGGEFLKPTADKVQPQTKLSVRPENQAYTPSIQTNNPKKGTLPENKKEVKPTCQVVSSSKAQKKVTKKPSQVPEPDESEAEAIWPKAERLSTHIHKLLAWRPACLLDTGYVSDSDGPLSEDEDPDNMLIMERPPCPSIEMPDLDDLDMASMLADLPDPEKPL